MGFSFNRYAAKQQNDPFADPWGSVGLPGAVDVPPMPTHLALGGFPMLGTSAAPSPMAPPAPESSGFMDTLARRASSLGYSLTPEDRKAALQRAMMMMGVRMLQGAQKEGLGSLAPAIASGFEGYAGAAKDIDQSHTDDAKFQLQKDALDRQNRLTDAQIGNLADDNAQKKAEFQARLQQRKDLISGRSAALAKLSPDLQAKLTPLIGEDNFATAYEKLVGVKPPVLKPEDLVHNVGRDMMQYDPKTGEWTKVHTAPAESSAANAPWAGIEYVTRGDTMVKVDKTTGQVTPIYQFGGVGADPDAARRAIAKDATETQIKNWSGDKAPDYWELYKQNYKAAEAYAPKKSGGPLSGGDAGPNRPDANNNPLNLKLGAATQKWLDIGAATVDPRAAQDGGQFLRFTSPDHGLQAAYELMFDPKGSYAKLSAADALTRWSGGGYGADVAGPLAKVPVSALAPDQKIALIRGMAKREGFSGQLSSTLEKVLAGAGGVDPGEVSDVKQMVHDVGRDRAMLILRQAGKTPGEIAALLGAAGG